MDAVKEATDLLSMPYPICRMLIYIDGNLVGSKVDKFADINVSNEKHKIKVIQEGFKPFVAIIAPRTLEERPERAFEVKFEPLNSVPAIPSTQPDTAK